MNTGYNQVIGLANNFNIWAGLIKTSGPKTIQFFSDCKQIFNIDLNVLLQDLPYSYRYEAYKQVQQMVNNIKEHKLLEPVDLKKIASAYATNVSILIAAIKIMLDPGLLKMALSVKQGMPIPSIDIFYVESSAGTIVINSRILNLQKDAQQIDELIEASLSNLEDLIKSIVTGNNIDELSRGHHEFVNSKNINLVLETIVIVMFYKVAQDPKFDFTGYFINHVVKLARLAKIEFPTDETSNGI